MKLIDIQITRASDICLDYHTLMFLYGFVILTDDLSSEPYEIE